MRPKNPFPRRIKRKISAAIFLFACLGFFATFLTQCGGGNNSEAETKNAAPRFCEVKDLAPEYAHAYAPPYSSRQLQDISLDISRKVFGCTESVVLVPTSSSLDTQILASRLAVSKKSPLLLYVSSSPQILETELKEELNRLAVQEVYLIGSKEVRNQLTDLLGDSISLRHFSENDSPGISLAIRQAINIEADDQSSADLPNLINIDPASHKNLKLLQLLRSVSMNALLEVADSPSNLESTPPTSEILESESIQLAKQTQTPNWLLSPEDLVLSLPALPALSALGGNLLIVNSKTDLRTSLKVAEHLRTTDTDKDLINARFIGERNENTDWQLGVLESASPLPSGGLLLFEAETLVSFYGFPENRSLGILGVYSNPADAIEGLLPYADLYQTGENIVTPTFEIIATIADREPGKDGDFSREISVQKLLPWVQAAREAGVYVILDLQPGRTDFLTQAKLYEELLSFENVGLALDPEWRLMPHQVHLEQIGRVDAEEVNQVANWLAELVRRKNLPQKLLLIHQFRFFMIQNREQIKSPPELAILFNFDGHGTFEKKLSGYTALSAPLPNEQKRLWGWKNFFDKDIPLAEPELIADLDPFPAYINYH